MGKTKVLRLLGLSVLLGVIACRHSNIELEKGLAFAGNNRPELEKVLKHYSKNPSDSLKLKAAKFLIINMPFHYGYYGKGIAPYKNTFSAIDTASYIEENISNEEKAKIGDSIVNIYGWPSLDSIEKVYDSKVVSAEYLIRNIDIAFETWLKAPWFKRVSFEDFCEYILPYRIKNEQLDEWRLGYTQRYMKMAKASSNPNDAQNVYGNMKWLLGGETSFNVFFDKYFPFDQSVGDVEKGRIGSCEITTFAAVTAMRSVGLPVGYDYIMHWGSSNSRHYMSALVGIFDSSQHLISNENVQEDTWHLVDFSSEFNNNRHKFISSEMPKGLYVQNVRTIPKVYRFSYSQSDYLLDINKRVPKEFISPEFRQTNLKDVTDQYVRTSDITIPIDKGFSKHGVGYLSVFDVNGWQPVAIAKIIDNKLSFRKIGKNTLFIPTVYHEGKHLPIAEPFYIDSSGKVHKIIASLDEKRDMKLLRKYPLYTYSAYHSEILKGGRFEGSSDSIFSNPILLYEIKNYPFFVTIVPVTNKKRFRYLRYVAPTNADFEPDNIAEVQFLTKNDRPLKGKVVGVEGVSGHEIEKAFDGDLSTYYQNHRNRDGWIGIDLGAKNRQIVQTIMFCPRNDTNGIMPGKEYELFYWDGNRWVTLGFQLAKKYSLLYKKVPSNGLYWLRCNSGGTEERIFTYENGTQKWW